MNLYRYPLQVREFYGHIIDAGGSIGSSTLNALATFVGRLIRSGLWPKLDEIYPLCGRGIASACVKLKYVSNPLMTNHNFTDEDFEEWGPNAGLVPDGLTKYLDTNFPVTSLRADAHLCYIEQSAISIGSGLGLCALGATDSTSEWSIGEAATGSANRAAILGDPASFVEIPGGYTNWTSFYIANREAGNLLRLFKRTHLKDTDTIPSAVTPLGAPSLFLCARNNDGIPDRFFPATIRFASVGQALTPAETIDLYQIVQTLQDSLGRAV